MDNPQAFPSQYQTREGAGMYSDGELVLRSDKGMTLREWYAGMALMGLCANPSSFLNGKDLSCLAKEYAKEMLFERTGNTKADSGAMDLIYEALGWQGGTVHQIVEEIKTLKRKARENGYS